MVEEDEDEEDLKKGGRKRGMRIVKDEDGERLEWDEDLVLGRKRGVEQGREGGVDESDTTASTTTPLSRVPGEGVGEENKDDELMEGEESELLPIQAGEMEDLLGARAGGRRGGGGGSNMEEDNFDKVTALKEMIAVILEEKRLAVEAGGLGGRGGGMAGTYKTEQQRAAHCVMSFLFFITYTVFAFIGLRATLVALRTVVGGDGK